MNHQPGAAANSVIWAVAGISVIVAAGFHIAPSTHRSSVKLNTSYRARHARIYSRTSQRGIRSISCVGEN
jgi:hypothetical protein